MQNEMNPVTEAGGLAANELSRTASHSTSAIVDSFTSAFSQIIELAPKVLAALAVQAK